MRTYDAVVVGAGPNGLSAANLLVDAGWDVLLLEAAPGVGGAVHSSRDVEPRFVTDTASAFYPLGVVSPVISALGLEEHGLRWRHAPAPLGHAFSDGDWALLHRSVEDTAAGLDADHPGDGQAWLDMYATFARIADDVVGTLLGPFPPVRGALPLAAKLPRVGGLDLVRTLLSPATDLVRESFGGRGARMLLAGNALHADIPLVAPGSGGFGWLMSMLAQHVGFPVPEGGAGELTAAMARRFEAKGGEIRCDSRVERVLVEGGRATGVRVAGGEQYAAARAVLADVSATSLYGALVPWADLPDKLRRRMGKFTWDPGTVKIDWALDRPVPWAVAPAVAPGTVHIGDSLEEMARYESGLRTGAQAGQLSDRPFLLTGQMTTSDATRSPAGTESFWAYTHVPHGADDQVVRQTVDAMEARLEELAPGFADAAIARRVLGPRELEAHDANLVGGSVNGGTAQLQQQLVFRPVPGTGRPTTPIGGLYLASASAHPGGGVHGACGANAARAALGPAALRAVRRLR
ncbi:phytoene desaturase family protein [Nocardioides pacificus]